MKTKELKTKIYSHAHSLILSVMTANQRPSVRAIFFLHTYAVTLSAHKSFLRLPFGCIISHEVMQQLNIVLILKKQSLSPDCLPEFQPANLGSWQGSTYRQP